MGKDMGRYIVKRVLIAAVTLLAITFLLFLLMDLLPGSPFNNEKLNEAQKALLEHKYGLDKPFFVRYWIYLKNLFHGDFGISYVIAVDQPVSNMMATRLPIPLRMGVQAILGRYGRNRMFCDWIQRTCLCVRTISGIFCCI